MIRTPTRTPRWAFLGAIVGVPLLVAACSAAGSGAVSSSVPDLGQGPAATGSVSAGATAAAVAAGSMDPCKLLTKADVQPLFSVPIVTQLPGPIPGTCEWAANDSRGGVNTSLDVSVMTGQDALDAWAIASEPGPEIMFSGVGDQAEHYPGSPDFVSITGDVLCKIASEGHDHLAGKMNYCSGC